jgi:hypothetical protein
MNKSGKKKETSTLLGVVGRGYVEDGNNKFIVKQNKQTKQNKNNL